MMPLAWDEDDITRFLNKLMNPPLTPTTPTTLSIITIAAIAHIAPIAATTAAAATITATTTTSTTATTTAATAEMIPHALFNGFEILVKPTPHVLPTEAAAHALPVVPFFVPSFALFFNYRSSVIFLPNLPTPHLSVPHLPRFRLLHI
jgi:hypothetical protein